jgi:purine-binding chemotaxis protein CheW
MEFGIVADAILGVRLVPAEDLQPSLPTLTDIRSEYLRGVTEDRLVVLDGGKILTDGKIVVHEVVL